jgi:Uma2 family endonuclease
MAPTKSEYYKGEVFGMAGASKEHSQIVASIIGALYPHIIGKGCSVFPSDLRVYNPENTLYTYPDVIVVCGQDEYLDDKFDTLLNPTVLFEVLSPTTESYDRGIKFKLYRTISSLQNYVLVSSTEYMVEVYTRSNDMWILTTAKGKDAEIYISALEVPLKLIDVYRQIDGFANSA